MKAFIHLSQVRLASAVLKAFFVIATILPLSIYGQTKKTLKAGSEQPPPLFIDPNGNVGIGQDKPLSKFHVFGNMRMEGGFLHMDGNPIYLRSNAQDRYDYIQWQPTTDRVIMGGYTGVRLGDTRENDTFFSILSVGRLKIKDNNLVAGIGVDIQTEARPAGSEPTTALTMLVTGDMQSREKGIRFNRTDGTQGIGFTANSIFTSGSASNQDLNMEVTGTGNLIFKTNNQSRIQVNSAGKIGIGIEAAVNQRDLVKMGGDFDMNGKTLFFRENNDGNDYIKWTGVGVPEETGDRLRVVGWNGVELGSKAYGHEKAFTVNRDGFAGIGIDNAKVPLQVNMFQNKTNYRYIEGVERAKEFGWGSDRIDWSNWRTFGSCSILAVGDIVTNNAFVSTQSSIYSDIRLKKDIRSSLSQQDLATLRQIQVSNYKMIDTIADNRQYKKVIAQQVVQVYPQAINKGFKTLPDVFQAAKTITHQSDSSYIITLGKSHKLKTGDQLELKCSEAGDVQVKVTAIQNDKSFTVTSLVKLDKQQHTFVYGHPATDVLMVDYDAISMLNVSATQQLAKIIDKQQQEIALLKERNAKLEQENVASKTAINLVMERLSRLEETKTTKAQPVLTASAK